MSEIKWVKTRSYPKVLVAKMIVFEETDDKQHVKILAETYDPMFTIEIFKICVNDPEHLNTFLESIKEHNWDLIFILLMYDCPEEVKVDNSLRESTLKEVFGYEQKELCLSLVENEIENKHPNKHAS